MVLLTMAFFTILFLVNCISGGISMHNGFDPNESTIQSVHAALFNGSVTCRDIVQAFLLRIEALNPYINAIITLNPWALETASRLDKRLDAQNTTGALFCVPLLLKDNFDAAGMPTTGGNLNLRNLYPPSDAPTVAALKRAGAVILGKVNMHELALEGISVSSLGGQTLNPYDLTRTPGGSSGGSGAAVAASFAVLSTGTDTVNSLRSPASANSLFSCRPTRGLISRHGIMPVSYSQDTAGPIARNVEDLSIALSVMARVGFDKRDNVTSLIPPTSLGMDYYSSLTKGSLKGLRLGLVETFMDRRGGDEASAINVVFDHFITRLKLAGVTVVTISEKIYDSPQILESFDVQRFEYREGMDRYLQRFTNHEVHPKTLNKLYSGKEFLVIPRLYQFVNKALMSSTSDFTYTTIKRNIQNLTLSVKMTFKRKRLDALIYPEQQNLVVKLGQPSQAGRNGILAAVTGLPVVAVPAGFSSPSFAAPIGVPVGIELLGLPWQEKKLLQIAYQIQQLIPARRLPVLFERSVKLRHLISVPEIIPDTSNIPASYPIGVL